MHFHSIAFARKTLNANQEKYTTTEKELLDVVFSFEKFRPYLLLYWVIVFLDHPALRFLMSKADAKPRLMDSPFARVRP